MHTDIQLSLDTERIEMKVKYIGAQSQVELGEYPGVWDKNVPREVDDKLGRTLIATNRFEQVNETVVTKTKRTTKGSGTTTKTSTTEPPKSWKVPEKNIEVELEPEVELEIAEPEILIDEEKIEE